MTNHILFLVAVIGTGFSADAESYAWLAINAGLALYWLVQIAKEK